MGLTRKKRTIHAPKVALKVIQKWFGFHLPNALQFDEFVFGFVKGRSAIDAASRHCGARWIYSVDIEDFFPSTPLDMVRRSLSDLGYSDHGAGLIAKLCCFNGGLAQGSPASPVLSNLVFKSTDEKFLELANSLGICYTRYADDVTFSGTSDFPARVKAEVHSIIEAGGWKVAKNKECIAMLPRRLKVSAKGTWTLGSR